MEWKRMLTLTTGTDKGKKLYALLLVCVVVLFGLSLWGGKDDSGQVQESGHETTQAYIQYYEKRLEDILSQTQGVGRVEVAITLEGGVQREFVEESQQESSDNDSGSQKRSSSSTLVIGTGSGQQAVVRQELQPKVRGVLIACDGANSDSVRLAVVEGVRTLLDIPSSRICVVQRK